MKEIETRHITLAKDGPCKIHRSSKILINSLKELQKISKNPINAQALSPLQACL